MNWNKAIYIGGVARSGTSWIGQVINSCKNVRFRFQPLFSYEMKNRVNEDSTAEEIIEFLDDLWTMETDFLTQSERVLSGEYPKFDKSGDQSCLAFKENRYQSVIEPWLRRVPQLYFIGVVRHPCGVLNSWRKNEKEFPAGSEISKEWRFGSCKNSGEQDYFGYYKWKEVANLYLDLQAKYPSRVCLVRYESMVQNRHEEARRIFHAFGLPFNSQTETFLNASLTAQSDSYYSVFQSPDVIDKWKTELDQYIVSEIENDVKNTRLEQFWHY